ncbi:alpha/beta fold hydrolase [Nonomuraea sp. NPDC049400]|uniref:alpha/beta fold hydrolase n=1 Tax=Nonomuraea sp. NPDC049400 TaxID=3364352 RepID=UPI0037A03584
MNIGHFVDDAARIKFYDIYERVLAQLWPGSPATLDVPTAFGPTRVYRAGRGQGPPIVLLSGASGNALMWHRYVRPLGDKHPLIAIDTIGEPGASVQQAPVRDGRDGTAWLGEVLAPAGFALPGPRFIGWALAGALAGLAPRALRPRLAKLVANGTILEPELMSLIPAAARYRRRLPVDRPELVARRILQFVAGA